MNKYNIQVETKQLWKITAELQSTEEAREFRDKMYEVIQQFISDNTDCINDTIQMTLKANNELDVSLEECYGGDDLSDCDITRIGTENLPKADTGKNVVEFSIILTCPHCGEKIKYTRKDPEYDIINNQISFNNEAVVSCPNCNKEFIQEKIV